MRPGRPSVRVRDERGFVLPTRLLALCVSAVAMSVLVYVANDPDQPSNPAATPAKSTPSQTATSAPATTTPTVKPKPKPKPLKRGEVFVEVFNNTRTKGLAGGVAEKARIAGWNVVGSDNWYGTIDGSTIYFPPRLKAAGKALGMDLGIKRVKLAEQPMRLDRLTVILTDDYR